MKALSYSGTLFRSITRRFSSRSAPIDASEYGPDFLYKGKHYVTHNTMHVHQSALHRLSIWQRSGLILLAFISACLLVVNWHLALVIFVSTLTLLYFLDLLFNLVLIYRSYQNDGLVKVTSKDLQAHKKWPTYTIFCPLYKEAIILPQFVASMKDMDYPKRQLQIMLLLEEDDLETQAAAKAMKLPKYFTIVVVPHSMPKTKPKACNYGLSQATGEYAVIYDAEDMPDRKQLKKAVVAFEKNKDKNIGCVQAKLNFYNWQQNLLTRLFTLEYSLWFDLVLTGLQSLNAPIPLGGTSNHFRVAHLKSFGGWDPFNVTEDADLGIRLSKNGYRTVILNSTTLEEANSDYHNWIRQRSRWIKGYIQTFFVHNRKSNALERRRDFLIFQLVIGGKVLSSLVNPLFWGLTVVYFLARSLAVTHFIQSLFIRPIFYMGIVSLVVGNFLYMYYYMLGAARRKQYELIPYSLCIPLYWLMISISSYIALKEFIVRPFHWQKTQHGLHLKETV